MIQLTALQESLAAHGIPGLRRIYTGRDLPRELYARDLPALLPDPAQPIESLVSTRMTLGGAGWITISVLRYVCLIAEAGQGRSPADHAERISQVMMRVHATLCDWSPDRVHAVRNVQIGDVGLFADPSGAKQHHGFGVRIELLTSY